MLSMQVQDVIPDGFSAHSQAQILEREKRDCPRQPDPVRNRACGSKHLLSIMEFSTKVLWPFENPSIRSVFWIFQIAIRFAPKKGKNDKILALNQKSGHVTPLYDQFRAGLFPIYMTQFLKKLKVK